jgi:hypothetical protein
MKVRQHKGHLPLEYRQIFQQKLPYKHHLVSMITLNSVYFSGVKKILTRPKFLFLFFIWSAQDFSGRRILFIISKCEVTFFGQQLINKKYFF